MIAMCHHLRSKALMAFDMLGEDELQAVYTHNEVPWSCSSTGRNTGPDDDLCAPERCAPGRGCFRPSPRLVRRQS